MADAMEIYGTCPSCGRPVCAGMVRWAGMEPAEFWHAECRPHRRDLPPTLGKRRQRTHPSERDIKAPDGFTLAGLRRVRADGTLLFGRSWWTCPAEWIGMRVWVHVTDCHGAEIEAAPPGVHIYTAQMDLTTMKLTRADRADAKPVYRRPEHKAWAARSASRAA